MERIQILRRATELDEGSLSFLEGGAGPPVILLHGVPTSAELWRGSLPMFVRVGYHCAAPDLPGYGFTRLRPSADHSLTGCARLLDRWLEAERHDRAWVVGHDLGGLVAQLLAVRAPQRVTRLTLINSVAAEHWPALRARLSSVAAKLGLYQPAARLRIVPNPFVRWQIRRSFSDPGLASRQLQNRVVWDTKVTSPEGREAFQRHLAALSWREAGHLAAELPRLRCPVDIVWGMEDPFQRWDPVALALCASLPSAHVTQLHGCGHFPPIEASQRMVEALLR